MKALAAEMTNYFSKRLEPLGIIVKELTGDMQLTKGEILRTQVTPRNLLYCEEIFLYCAWLLGSWAFLQFYDAFIIADILDC